MTKTDAARRAALDAKAGRPPYKAEFDSLGDFLVAVHGAGVDGIENADDRLEYRVWPESFPDRMAAVGADGDQPSAGGFLVQADHATELHERLYNTSEIIKRCSPWPAPRETLRVPMVDETSRANGSRFGGVTMAFYRPGEEISATKPKFRLSEFNRRKLAGLVYTTAELLDDAAALGAIFTRLYGLEGAFVIEREIVSGDGTIGPLGILNADATIEVAKESGQVAATVVAANIVNMAARFWAAGWPRATWLANQNALPQLLSLRWTDNAGAAVPLLTFGADGPPRLAGAPLILTEVCPTVGSRGDIILADLSEYILTEPRDLAVDFSPHVKFTTDEGAFRFKLRVDGAPAWNTPTTPLNGSATVSPFVVLAARE